MLLRAAFFMVFFQKIKVVMQQGTTSTQNH